MVPRLLTYLRSPQDELKYVRFLFLCVETESVEVALKTCQRTF